MSDQHPTHQPCRTEVCAWVACHAGELAALGTPAVLAATVSTWFWAVTALSGAGWTVHEIRQQHRRRALKPATSRQHIPGTHDSAPTETSTASGAAREGA